MLELASSSKVTSVARGPSEHSGNPRPDWKRGVRAAILYVAIGLLNTSTTVLLVAVASQVFLLPNFGAGVAGYAAASLIAYFLYRRVVFRNATVPAARGVSLVKYFLVQSVLTILNGFLFSSSLIFLPVGVLVAQALSGAFIAILGFVSYRLWVFRGAL